MKKTLVVALGCTLVTPLAQAGLILNPSFEDEPDGLMPNGNPTSGSATWGMPADWSWNVQGPMNGHGIRFDDTVGWASEGDWSLYVFASTAGFHNPGDFLEFLQPVDLTGVQEIKFDAMLLGGQDTDSFFAIDGVNLWTENLAGTYLAVSIDVSGYTGVHQIGVGVEVFSPFGSNADGKTYFDNLSTVVPAAATLPLLGLAGLMGTRRRKV